MFGVVARCVSEKRVPLGQPGVSGGDSVVVPGFQVGDGRVRAGLLGCIAAYPSGPAGFRLER